MFTKFVEYLFITAKRVNLQAELFLVCLKLSIELNQEDILIKAMIIANPQQLSLEIVGIVETSECKFCQDYHCLNINDKAKMYIDNYNKYNENEVDLFMKDVHSYIMQENVNLN